MTGDTREIVGKKFGKLLIENEYIENKHRYCDYTCDCGTKARVQKSDLLRTDSRQIKACKMCRGALSTQRAIDRTGYNGAVNRIYYGYKRGAKLRKLEFTLSIEDFYILSQKECIYCGRKPLQKAEEGLVDFKYNGIDRLDNSIGYVLDNCVTACKICNFAKSSMNYDIFINWIKDIVIFNKEKFT